MEHLAESYDKRSTEDQRTLEKEYINYRIKSNESISKLERRFIKLLNDLRAQGVTKDDKNQRFTFIAALRQDDWNSNRKILTERNDPKAMEHIRISVFSELILAAEEMEKEDRNDKQLAVMQANNAETPSQHQGKKNSCGNRGGKGCGGHKDQPKSPFRMLMPEQLANAPKTGCHQCGEQGHKRNTCPRRGSQQNEKGKQEYQKWRSYIDSFPTNQANNAHTTQQQSPVLPPSAAPLHVAPPYYQAQTMPPGYYPYTPPMYYQLAYPPQSPSPPQHGSANHAGTIFRNGRWEQANHVHIFELPQPIHAYPPVTCNYPYHSQMQPAQSVGSLPSSIPPVNHSQEGKDTSEKQQVPDDFGRVRGEEHARI